MIKIYTLLIAFIFTATVTNAQFTVGQKVLSGNIDFSASKSDNVTNSYTLYKNTGISLSPSYGRFIKPNLLVGVGLSYGYSYLKINYPGQAQESRMNAAGVNFFTERFFTLTKNFYFTINSGIYGNYNFGKQKDTINNSVVDIKSNGYNVSATVAPGLSYRVTKRFLMEAYLNNFLAVEYDHSQSTRKSVSEADIKTHWNAFTISSRLTNTSNLGYIGVGFKWLIGKQ